MSDDCWTGPQDLAKKEELAVQQSKRIAPPFPDVSQDTCGYPEGDSLLIEQITKNKGGR